MKNFLTRNNNDVFSLFDDAFNSFLSPVIFNGEMVGMKADMVKTETGYNLMVDLPSFKKEDIKLKLEDGYLTITATKNQEEKEDYILRERNYNVSRSFYVGENVAQEDIKAKLNNGTLEVEINVKEKEEKSKFIEID
ncbi:MAG: Hsp20 family protein [Clostridia bacterium]|nr:Hsp20 family protein [Clostridia bacterium]